MRFMSSTSLLQRLDVGRVLDQRELQAEAGEDGAQVVADAGEHGRALLDLALDAAAHLVEGDRRLAHLAGAARREVRRRRGPCRNSRRRRRAAGSAGSGCAGRGWRWRAARGWCRPSRDEDQRVRGIGLAAAGEDAQDACRRAGCGSRRGCERPTVSIQNGLPICLVISRLSVRSSREKNGFGAGRRQRLGRQDGDVEAEAVVGDAGDLGDSRRPADRSR